MIVVQCPECKDSVRLPRSYTSLDIEVRCPLCGFSAAIENFADQLPPELEIIDAAATNNSDTTQWPTTDLTAGDNASEAIGIDLASSIETGLDSSDGAESMDFASSAGDIQTKKVSRRSPSVFKMLFQWFGGGAMGIGIAVGILYVWFPERLQEFLPLNLPQRETAPGGSNSEFIPRSIRREAETDTFLPRGQGGELLNSMALPTGEEEMDADNQGSSDDPAPEQTTDLFEQRIEQVSAALATVQDESNSADPEILTTQLFQAIVDLGKFVGSDPSMKQLEDIRAVLREIADGDQWRALALQTSDWLRSENRQSNEGIFIAAEIGDEITVQTNPDLASAPVRWKDQKTLPITIYGPTDELSANRGKRTIMIGVIEQERDDITGSGQWIRVLAIHPL